MKKKIPIGLVVIIVSLGSGLLGYYGAKSETNTLNALPHSVMFSLMILFVPAFFFAIAFHEAGHAFAGTMVKFDFRMFVVGPFMWDKELLGWKFKWNKNVNIAGGLVMCLPVGEENLSKRFSIFAAGGPAASILLVALAYGVFAFLDSVNVNHYVGLQIVAYFFLMLAVLSASIFIATSVPMQMGGFATDGARVLRLLRGGDRGRFEMLIIKIFASSTSGVRPKDSNLGELEEAQVLAKKLNAPFGVYLHAYFHQVAFDKGDSEKAEYHLQQYIDEADQIPDGMRSAVWLDAAFFYAFAKKDLQTATLYWNKFKPSALISKAQINATEAAINLLGNEKELYVSKIEAALKELPNMIDKGMAVALKEKLSQMENKSYSYSSTTT